MIKTILLSTMLFVMAAGTEVGNGKSMAYNLAFGMCDVRSIGDGMDSGGERLVNGHGGIYKTANGWSIVRQQASYDIDNGATSVAIGISILRQMANNNNHGHTII